MDDRRDTTPPLRVPPEVTTSAAEFWSAGEHGDLMVPRCQDCGLWQLPPTSVCHHCRSRAIAGERVSGRGVVMTMTINRQQWNPAGHVDPYIVAIVELAEQEGLRLVTNIVGCAVDEVSIGMPVRVVFEQLEDVWLPLFEPV